MAKEAIALDCGSMAPPSALAAAPDHTENRLLAVARRAHRVLGCDGVGVIQATHEGAVALVQTAEVAAELDRLQCALKTGPVIDAMQHLQVLTAGVRELGWWAEFGRAASERGVRTCLAVPSTPGGQVIGALGFYSYRSGAFDHCEELAPRFGAAAGGELPSTTYTSRGPPG